ncbi:hypothetical protein VTI74DRAFT_4841 [Chaetomium olivicolor]
MEMSYPPPLKSKANPNSGEQVDYSMTSPLKADGSDFPCKGYLSLLNTTQAKPVASWTAGQTYNFTISGGAAHGGGSCQAALSVDGGKTFRVLHSYEGGCPRQGQSSFPFAVPGDTPTAQGAVFGWTWFNNLGNREMYMNCAVVDILGNAVVSVHLLVVAPGMSLGAESQGIAHQLKPLLDLRHPAVVYRALLVLIILPLFLSRSHGFWLYDLRYHNLGDYFRVLPSLKWRIGLFRLLK